NKAQVEAPDGKLSFKITEAALNDMSEQHPLYLMVQKIRNCIQEINIEVYQVKEINSQSQADERKIGIKIDTKNKSVPLSCLLVRTANSTTYYTFYPRRLHSFSLMKY